MAIKETSDRGRIQKRATLTQIRKMTGMTALPSHRACRRAYQFVRLLVSSRIGAVFPFTVFALLSATVEISGHRNVAFMSAYGNDGITSVSFQTIERGHQSGMVEPLRVVARNTAEWEALWRKHNAFRSHQPKLPVINFNREIVIGVFLGNRSTGGYEVEIVNISRDDGMFAVSFIEKTPPRNGMVIQSLTQPFHLVRASAEGYQEVTFRRVP